MNKRNEIGGGYWISRDISELKKRKSESRDDYYFISRDEQHLSTCRSCLSYIASLYDNNKVIIVPFFTCNTVIEPFEKDGWKVVPYLIDKYLRVKWEYLKQLVIDEHPSLVLFHSYFGFPTINDNKECVTWIKENGVDIINDVTCSLLSSFDRIDSKYCVGSIRKWFPVPDGSLLQGVHISNVNRCNCELEKAKLDAFFTKNDYLLGCNISKKSMLAKFSYATSLIDNASDPYCMSTFSSNLLTKDYVDDVKRKRIDNYNHLYENLSNIKNQELLLPLPKADNSIVPYLFPIIVRKRSNLQKYLSENDIYATILWRKPISFAKIKDQESLYETILCLPINHCYNIGDMDRIVFFINEYFKLV